jgi:hypothetical protein
MATDTTSFMATACISVLQNEYLESPIKLGGKVTEWDRIKTINEFLK